MSYSNGLGTLQHLVGNLVTNASLNAKIAQTANGTYASATKTSGGDATKFSVTSGLVSQMVGGPDVRLDKVAPLQALIANGAYNISAGDVASSILNSLLN